MKALLVLVALILAAAVTATSGAHAASAKSAPSIVIKSPTNGAVIHGSTITVKVAVSNITLVGSNAPSGSKGTTGHVVYVLDDSTVYSATQDVAHSLSHTWTHVHPGHHTVGAYLANSKNLEFPTPSARDQVTVTVVAPPAKPTPQPTKPVQQQLSPGVGSAPRTGGGAGQQSNSSYVYVLFAGLFLLAVGLLFLGRRYAFATTGGTRRPERPHGPVPEARNSLEPQPIQDRPTPAPVPEPLPAVSSFRGFGGETDGSVEERSPVAPRTEGPTESPSQSEVPRAEPNPFAPPAAPSTGTDRPAHWDVPSLQPVRQAPPPEPERPASTGGAPGLDSSRARALEMAQQWSTVIHDLVRQLEQQEVERREMVTRISVLEQAVRAHQSLKTALAEATGDPLSREDMQAIQYVTDSLIQDPDHIVVLASVAQHAEQLARIVNNYARIHRALLES